MTSIKGNFYFIFFLKREADLSFCLNEKVE